MSQQLPSNASLKHLKQQAKQLLKAHQLGDAGACTRFQTHVPRLVSNPKVEGLKLRDAYLVLAREYGFASWPKLKHHLDERSRVQSDKTPHEILLERISQLIAEQTEATAQVVRRMLEDPKEVGILMISLGQETSAAVMKYLSDAEIEHIAQAISELDTVTTEQEDDVLKNFEQMMMAGKYVSKGGIDYARGALEKALGPRKADAILRRIRAQHRAVVERLNKLETERPEDVARALSNEEPEHAAILKNAVEEDRFADELSHLPETILNQMADVDMNDISTDEQTEALESLEQVIVALGYVALGGRAFAFGALSKAMGRRKAEAILERTAPISGILSLHDMSAEQICAVLENESSEFIAQVLSTLEGPLGMQVFTGLTQDARDRVANILPEQTTLSENQRRIMDQQLAEKIDATA